jgi:hypothetical protein
MARDRYHNVFYYYKGPSKPGDEADENRHHQQLEDNTTKALVNLLEYSPPSLTTSFLVRFVPAIAAELDAVDSFEYDLHEQEPSEPPADPIRCLIGLSPLCKIAPDSWSRQGTGSVVDAAIRAPGKSTVVIEVKINGPLDGAQLIRHANAWGVPCPSPPHPPADLPAEWILISWKDIYAWAREEFDSASGEPTRFLLGQFVEYLEHTSLAPFSGFQQADFRFFESAPDRRPPIQLDELKTRLDGLWRALEDDLQPDEANQLGEIHIGLVKMRDDHAWLTTNWHEDVANLTLELHRNEFQLNLVGWKQDQARRVESWLWSADAPSGLAGLPGYQLIVWKRRAKILRSGKPFFKDTTFQVVDQVPTAHLAHADIRAAIDSWSSKIDPSCEKLAYHLRKTWPKDEVLAREEKLAGDTMRDVRRLLPLLKRINGAGTSRRARVTLIR